LTYTPIKRRFVGTNTIDMNIADKIKTVREAKGLSQKEVALNINMDASQYSKIENGKNDPSSSTLDKIAQALGVSLSELFASEDIFRDVNSADKTLVEKIRLIEALEPTDRTSIFSLIDSLFAKKKLKDTLSNALQLTH
jgi:transcriptional regulator with XRE-family HTH domain